MCGVVAGKLGDKVPELAAEYSIIYDFFLKNA